MRNILLGAASALALAPGVASAALTLNVPSATSDVPGATKVIPMEIFFSETAPVVNEQLAGFTLRLEIVGGSSTGVHMASPTSTTANPTAIQLTPTEHPYVLSNSTLDSNTGEPTAPARPSIPANPDAYTPNSLTVSGLTDPGLEQNVDDNEGLLKFYIAIEPTAAPGTYAIMLDPLVTAFSDANAADIPVGFTPLAATIVVTPEPASLGLLALGGLLGLRRRRTA